MFDSELCSTIGIISPQCCSIGVWPDSGSSSSIDSQDRRGPNYLPRGGQIRIINYLREGRTHYGPNGSAWKNFLRPILRRGSVTVSAKTSVLIRRLENVSDGLFFK